MLKRKITERLIEWKNRGKDRMPIIMKGARQVGKTYILREFGEKNYKNIVYVNLETNLSVASFFENDISPERIIRYLESAFGVEIIPEQTLIFFDEIQTCERALTSLKYFCEDAPEFHIVAAGSLLGVAINRTKHSFPVGKVQSLTLYPLDFEEFLWALGKEGLSKEISESYFYDKPLPERLHIEALELYRHFLIIGGMPAPVMQFVETGKLIEIANIQNEILNNYLADMSKYSSNSESVKIRGAYNSIPSQLAKENKKFQYKVIGKGGNSAMFGESIDWLNFAGVVLKCQKIEHAFLPIAVYCDLSSFKLYMGDVGLLTFKTGLAYQTLLSGFDVDNTFLGALAENYVAQALASKNIPLYYWESKSTAEIDFVIQQGEKIIPIEVKFGTHTRSRSLSVFKERYKIAYSIRISARNFGFENNVKSVPLYAVYNI